MKKTVKIIILFSLIIVCFNIMYPSKSYAIRGPIESIIDLFHNDRIYTEPGVDKDHDTGDDLGDMIENAEAFENRDGDSLDASSIFGKKDGTALTLQTSNLQTTSSNIYTAFLIIATAICVIVGVILGIKFVYGGIEAQAEVKKLLKPYLIGCLVIFGAFGIWNLAVNILASV